MAKGKSSGGRSGKGGNDLEGGLADPVRGGKTGRGSGLQGKLHRLRPERGCQEGQVVKQGRVRCRRVQPPQLP